MHPAVHTAEAMSRKTNTAVGFRIPNDLLELITAEAEASDMSRNEFVVRRLRKSFSRARETRKTADNSRSVGEPLRELE